ncbi:hypothetical protein [Brevibacterium oceani]|uniref:hypothetical protein n=1 Tax=Brevibacterium oceani TaxID=358099 RepID=UPI0015E73FD9|nr:hypothetical protein [Brevibacterium oceani]
MAHTFDEDAFVEAYDKTTGKKVGRVPKTHLKIFPNLSATPKARAAKPKPVEAPKIPDFISSNTEKEG